MTVLGVDFPGSAPFVLRGDRQPIRRFNRTAAAEFRDLGRRKVTCVHRVHCYRFGRCGACALVAIVLTVWPTAITAHAQALATRHDMDRNQSAVYVVTKRSGLLSFLGHDHSILAHEWHGSICASDAPVPQGHGSIIVHASSLEIDSDSARMLAGLGRGPNVGQRRTLQQTLFDERHLAAESFPTLVLDVEEIVTVGASSTAYGRLAIRDRTHDVEFPIELARSGDSLRIMGVLHVNQSDFGIRPESIAGLVRVADRVAIHFNLLTVNTRTRCR
jgi:polyisoprenoid-binding protein YceI